MERNWPGLTPEEEQARIDLIAAALRQMHQRLEDGRCIECGETPEWFDRASCCVYAMPCGHRQGPA